MGQDYYNCVVCDEIQGDYSHHGWCKKCGFLCGECYNEMVDKYGKNDNGEAVKCDACDYIDKKEKLYEYVLDFMRKNKVTCHDSIHQTDRVQEELTGFACGCFDFVKEEFSGENDED